MPRIGDFRTRIGDFGGSMKPKRKKSWFDAFKFGKAVSQDDHPRSHCWNTKPIKVHITKHKQTHHKQIMPEMGIE